MTQHFIPPVFTEAEKLPAAMHFRNRPACEFRVGDIIKLPHEGKPTLFRIKAIRRSRYTVALTFILWKVDGGRPETETLMPRRWYPIARGY